MLDAMRRGAVNWLAKVLLGLLIVAFASGAWPTSSRSYGRGTLARVGNTEISAEEYRQAYQEEMASISRRLGGRRLTAEQAKMLGVEQRTLSRLIGTAAIDTHAQRAAPGALRPGHRRHHPHRPGIPGRDRQVLDRHLPQPSAPERHPRSPLSRPSRRKEEVRDQLTDTLLAGVARRSC